MPGVLPAARMRALMRNPDRTRALPRSPLALLRVWVLAALVCGVGCGREIGDECVINVDCSPNGDRVCIDPPAGSCTIQGCDFNTCPEEAVCVRFFNGGFSDRQCNRLTEDDGTDQCSFDELCSLTAEPCDPAQVPDAAGNPDACGRCVARSAEIRFCMRTCEGDDDCREGYECRDEELMKEHGGEPVPRPGESFQDAISPFCATAP